MRENENFGEEAGVDAGVFSPVEPRPGGVSVFVMISLCVVNVAPGTVRATWKRELPFSLYSPNDDVHKTFVLLKKDAYAMLSSFISVHRNTEKIMSQHQAAIVQDLPLHAVYLSFDLQENASQTAVRQALQQLQALADGQRVVIGIGASLAGFLQVSVPGLREFTGIAGSKVRLPATPAALWCWLREDERGELLHQQIRLQQALAGAFVLQQKTEAFKYAGGRDLSGYEDGTENPQGDEVLAVAIAADGGSYVAIQQWEHRFERLQAMPQAEQDNMIGRRKDDNEELDEAPESAHVKRTAQENFEPEAFVMRRSMPWADGARGGLYFVAFATSYAAFEAQLRRMSGAEDGMTDALFQFTQPQTGSYFWCPPLLSGKADLRLLGVD